MIIKILDKVAEAYSRFRIRQEVKRLTEAGKLQAGEEAGHVGGVLGEVASRHPELEPVIKDMVLALMKYFEATGATNYVVMDFGTPRGDFVLTFGPKDRVPHIHETIQSLKNRASDLEGWIVTMIESLGEWSGDLESYTEQSQNGAFVRLHPVVSSMRAHVGILLTVLSDKQK